MRYLIFSSGFEMPRIFLFCVKSSRNSNQTQPVWHRCCFERCSNTKARALGWTCSTQSNRVELRLAWHANLSAAYRKINLIQFAYLCSPGATCAQPGTVSWNSRWSQQEALFLTLSLEEHAACISFARFEFVVCQCLAGNLELEVMSRAPLFGTILSLDRPWPIFVQAFCVSGAEENWPKKSRNQAVIRVWATCRCH